MVKILVPSKITEDLAEETGWHIGDGSMNFYVCSNKIRGIYQLRGHIEDDMKHYIERIKPLFKKIYGLDISLRKMESTRVFGFQIWNCDLINFKKRLGLPLGEKINIGIPKLFFERRELITAVIRGIFDTDGCLYFMKRSTGLYPSVEICSTSSVLIKQLVESFKKLEIRATFYSWQGKGNRKRAYKVLIRGEEMLHKFMKTIKPANPKHQEKYKFFLNSQSF